MSEGIRFGTDGWRAVIAEEFTFENIRIIAQAMSDYLKETGKAEKGIAVGYDTRFMSDKFASTIADVLGSNGIHVYLSYCICPTPLLSYAVYHRKLAGGIMVTASHNPYIYNGVKFKAEYGGSAMIPMTQAIESQLGINKPIYDSVMSQNNIETVDFFPEYRHHVTRFIDFEKINNYDKTIAIDSMHGAGLTYLSQFLENSTIKVATIRCNPHPTFNGILPEPILKNLHELRDAILDFDAFIGLATDGDGDRFGILDENGSFVELHDLMPLIFEYIMKTRHWPGDVVRTTSMHNTIDLMAAKYDRHVIEVPVGFKNVCEQMLEHIIIIGGEESGGFGFYNHIPERDGILSCLLFLEMMASTDKNVSQMVKILRNEYGPFVYGRVDEYFNPLILHKNLESLRSYPPNAIGGFRVSDVSLIDGIKFYFRENAWMLMRVSQTEPLCRVYVGAEIRDHVDELLKAGVALLTREC